MAEQIKFGGHSLHKNKRREVPKAESSYRTAPVMVHLCKPAHYGDIAFTEKTGGCNSKADVVERTLAYKPARGT